MKKPEEMTNAELIKEKRHKELDLGRLRNMINAMEEQIDSTWVDLTMLRQEQDKRSLAADRADFAN